MDMSMLFYILIFLPEFAKFSFIYFIGYQDFNSEI